METLLNLSGSVLFILVLASAFCCAAITWFILSDKLQSSLDNYKDTFTTTASDNMADMFMFVDPNQLFIANIIAIVIFPGLVWLITGDLTATLVMLGMVIILPTLLYRSMRKKRLQRFEAQLPDTLTLISGSMRAGASLNIALESVVKEQPAPLAQEFELFLKEQRLGVDFEQSLKTMEQRNPIPDLGLLITALLINREVGGNLAETMETLGDTLRRKAMMEGKIESLTAQGKLQGIVMTGLPVLLGVLLNFMEPEAMSKLWTTNIGYVVMAVIIFMEALGYMMIRKITSIDV